jgi:hypothetical protein
LALITAAGDGYVSIVVIIVSSCQVIARRFDLTGAQPLQDTVQLHHHFTVITLGGEVCQVQTKEDRRGRASHATNEYK